jgi:hypothetical protein
MRHLLLPSLLLLLTCAVGFSSAADEKMASSTAYYPALPGSVWSYKAGENRFQIRLAKLEKVTAKAAAVVAARMELVVDGKVVSHEHIAVTAEGVVRMSYEGKEASPPIKFLSLAPKKGEKWKVDSKIDTQPLKGEFVVDEVENIKATTNVYPKGVTVTGKDLEANGVKMTLTYTFVENVGMVKQLIEMGGQKILIELEKYEPGKAEATK